MAGRLSVAQEPIGASRNRLLIIHLTFRVNPSR
jgi:hypothetical protein